MDWILRDLTSGERLGISGVAVECVDTRRNTDGEGRVLDRR